MAHSLDLLVITKMIDFITEYNDPKSSPDNYKLDFKIHIILKFAGENTSYAGKITRNSLCLKLVSIESSKYFTKQCIHVLANKDLL